MAAGDEDPPLNHRDVVAPINDRDVSTARGDDTEEYPRIPPSKKRHGHQGDGLQQLVARLPDDLLADVLGRLAPRWLTASCVCKAWRDAVDDRGLLRADLLPLSLSGIFIHVDEHRFPEFFSRPSSSTGARGFSGSLDFLPSVDALDGQNRSSEALRRRGLRLRQAVALSARQGGASHWLAKLGGGAKSRAGCLLELGIELQLVY